MQTFEDIYGSFVLDMQRSYAILNINFQTISGRLQT